MRREQAWHEGKQTRSAGDVAASETPEVGKASVSREMSGGDIAVLEPLA